MIHLVDNMRIAAQHRQLCITHAGVFHADEVLATAILERAFGAIYLARVSEVPASLPRATIVYDIGGGCFDHHQPGGNGTRPNGIPYASAGLIWRAYGMKALGQMHEADQVKSLVDTRLIEGIDAADNGLSVPTQTPGIMSISQVVSSFNPQAADASAQNAAFLKAEWVMREVLDNTVQQAQTEADSRSIVERAIETSDNAVMTLDAWMPWQHAFFTSKNPLAARLSYVIYPSTRGGYNCQAIPVAENSRKPRNPFPESWRGLKGSEFKKTCGVPSATFCHAAGFIAGATTLAGARAIARRAQTTSYDR